jgi:hypothetical protein
MATREKHANQCIVVPLSRQLTGDIMLPVAFLPVDEVEGMLDDRET